MNEWNALFNDTPNTFYLRLYGVRHMVKDHSVSERGNPLLPHGLLFPISSKGSFYIYHPSDRIAFVTPVVEHWLEWEIPQWVYHEGSIRQPITPWADALTTELHLAPFGRTEWNIRYPVQTTRCLMLVGQWITWHTFDPKEWANFQVILHSVISGDFVLTCLIDLYNSYFDLHLRCYYHLNGSEQSQLRYILK